MRKSELKVKKICPVCWRMFESYACAHRVTDSKSCGMKMGRLKTFHQAEYSRRMECASQARDVVVSFGFLEPLEEEW